MWDHEVLAEEQVSLVELAVDHWMYLMKFASAYAGYRKVLVPTDLTAESEGILPLADELLHPEGEGVLLHVIPSVPVAGAVGKPKSGESSNDDWNRNHASERMTRLVDRLGYDANRWRCEVISAPSVAHGVISFASRESVNVIVMNTHERKGMAKLTKRSISKEVQQKAPVEVKVFRTRELAQISN